MALWSGRFTAEVDAFTERFGASIGVDKALYREDIAGSIAHATMLGEQGIIPAQDAEAIVAGLEQVRAKVDAGDFAFDSHDEDVHMAVERALTELIGEAGGRLHTARSRNDQVACDTRLYVKGAAQRLAAGVLELREALIGAARAHGDAIIPGFTHLQHAQPVLLGHHFLAYTWMLARDFGRILAAFEAADECPLGSAALAGVDFPVDRERTAQLLGFSDITANSLDAVSNRDFALDLEYACSLVMMHLSRLCEEIVLWSSQEFGYITLSDSFSTGSSIMPQKKNPDFAELIRGKTGRVYGDLLSLLTVMKGLPLAYNKDMQEDKEGLIDAVDTACDCLQCMAGMVSTLQVNREACARALRTGHLAATDVADYLVKKGMPFRQAHAVVGGLVLAAEQAGCTLDELPAQAFAEASPLFGDDMAAVFDMAGCVAARNVPGGTAPEAVAAQMEQAEARLAADEERLCELEGSLGPAFA